MGTMEIILKVAAFGFAVAYSFVQLAKLDDSYVDEE